LTDEGYISSLEINVIILKHPEHVRKVRLRYQEEVEYLINSRARNEFITDLAANISGNTMILYYRISHGKELTEMLMKKLDRPVYFVDGGVPGEERNAIRGFVEEHDNAIVVASYGTFSTGINVKRLHNIVMASAWKSRVINLQSIGRGLRKGHNKDVCQLFDITDDLSWKKRRNYTLIHGEKRIMLYNHEQFDYHIDRLDL
jgi:Kyanoviridae DNA helicase